GKWYRSYQNTLAQPGRPEVKENIRELICLTIYDGWECVPYPSPLDINLGSAYLVDKDLGLFTVDRWAVDVDEGGDSTLFRRTTLTNLPTGDTFTPELALESFHGVFFPQNFDDDNGTQTLIYEHLTINMRKPTSLNELQLLFMNDFIAKWGQNWNEAPRKKRVTPLYRSLSIVVLRIAAWDVEVQVPNYNLKGKEVTIVHHPTWPAPSSDVFWFHGFLIVLHEDINAIGVAIKKAQWYLPRNPHRSHVTHMILMVYYDIRLIEISSGPVKLTPVIPLIRNCAPDYPKPGSRVLTSILSSAAWKPLPKSRLPHLPNEILDMILEHLSQRDIVSAAQAFSYLTESYYSPGRHSSNLRVRDFDRSIPCCGIWDQPDTEGFFCSTCYKWYHRTCLGLSLQASSTKYVCYTCEHPKPGGIPMTGMVSIAYGFSRPSCNITINGVNRSLQLFTSGRDVEDTSQVGGPIWQIRYTLSFGDAFSGLAYGF
ncbi:hypothetical protein BO94DRAFT_592595, partial [Aspergillus sclerotioniger CBS 115572]